MSDLRLRPVKLWKDYLVLAGPPSISGHREERGTWRSRRGFRDARQFRPSSRSHRRPNRLISTRCRGRAVRAGLIRSTHTGQHRWQTRWGSERVHWVSRSSVEPVGAGSHADTKDRYYDRGSRMTENLDTGPEMRQSRYASLAMAATMMACCVAVLAVFALIPIVGWPIGLALGAAALGAMAFVHQRWMGHGGHH